MSEDANRDTDCEVLDLPDLLDVHATLVDETEFTIDLLNGLKQEMRKTDDIRATLDKVESKLKSICTEANKLEESRIRCGVHYNKFYDAIAGVLEVQEGIQQLRWQYAAAKNKRRHEVLAVAVKMSAMLLRHLETLETVDSSLNLMTFLDWVLGLLIKTAARVSGPLGALRRQLEETLIGLSGSNDTDLLDEITELIEIDRKKNFPGTERPKSDEEKSQSGGDGNSNSQIETDLQNDPTHFSDSNPQPETKLAAEHQGTQPVPDDEIDISENISKSAKSKDKTVPQFSPGAGPSSRPYSSRRTPDEYNGGPRPAGVGLEADDQEISPETTIHPTTSTSSMWNNPGTPSEIPPLRSKSIAESKPVDTEQGESILRHLNPDFKLEDDPTQLPVNPPELAGDDDNSRKYYPIFVPEESIGSSSEIQPDIEELMDDLDVSGENSAISDKIEEDEKEASAPREFPPEIEDPEPEVMGPEMYLALGSSYWSGEITGVDYRKALVYLRIALRAKLYAACYMLGKMYADGNGVERDTSTAFNLFIRGAKSGDAKCFYEVGRCFEFGFAVTRNVDLMRRFYDIAVEKECPEAMARVGYHKLYGLLYDQDSEAASDLIDEAVGKYNSDAKAWMALCFLMGIVYDRRLKYAKELLDDACESTPVSRHGGAMKLGSTPGLMIMAECSMKGVFEACDEIEAARLYKELSNRALWPCDPARVQYARCLLFGTGVLRDYPAGLELLRESTGAHFADAWALLGVCYRDGVGVQKNLDQAFEYFMQAACSVNGIRGITEAHFALGEMYENGNGVEKDMDRAIHHYMSASNRLHTEAQFRVGLAFEMGKGLEKSVEQSHHYYRLAARAGHAIGQRKLGERYAKGLGVQKCLWGAHKMLEEAAIAGDQRARKMLTRTRVKLLFSRIRLSECECCARSVKPRNAHFFEHVEQPDFMNI